MLLGIEPRLCKVCKEGLYRNKTLFSGGWSRCALCEEFVHYSCLASGKVSFLKARPRLCKTCRACRRGHSFLFAEGSDSGGRRVVTPHSQSSPVEARPGWHTFFSDSVRFVLAPLILLLSGFFTANLHHQRFLHLVADKSDVGADAHGADSLP